MLGSKGQRERDAHLQDLLALSGPIEIGNKQLKLVTSRYANGRLAIEAQYATDTYDQHGNPLRVEGQRYEVLTLNMPEVDLKDDEILVKAWDHDERFYDAVLENYARIFSDTGRCIHTQHGIANVWKLAPAEKWGSDYGLDEEEDEPPL